MVMLVTCEWGGDVGDGNDEDMDVRSRWLFVLQMFWRALRCDSQLCVPGVVAVFKCHASHCGVQVSRKLQSEGRGL